MTTTDPSTDGPDPQAVSRTALATLRRHAAAPLTGTPPFWERLVREVLAAEAALRAEAGGEPDADAVAPRAAPAMSGSPVTNSPVLWRAIVATVLSEHRAPSGMGEPIPTRWHRPRLDLGTVRP